MAELERPSADGPPAAQRVDSPPAAPSAGPRPAPPRVLPALASAAKFARRIIEKAGDDRIFFMAGAIAFNVLVAFVPLVLAVIGIGGTILRQAADPTQPLMEYILESLPPVSPEFELAIRQILLDVIDQSTSLLSVGTIILVWVATRLVSTLRTVLLEVFDLHWERGIIEGKIFDIQMVLAAGTLFTLNVGLTIALHIVTEFGVGFIGLDPAQVRQIDLIYGRVVAFAFIWVMFLLIYRYLPARKIHWETALVAATITAVLFEVLKQAFGWYVTSIADFGSTYGNLATLVILIFWIYYSAIAFILGGEIAQVVAMHRIRRRQKERLS